MAVNLQDALKIAQDDPNALNEAQKQLLIKHGKDDFVRGGQTQSPLGNLAILAATYGAVKAPFTALTIAGAPTNMKEISQELTMLKQNPLNIGKLASTYKTRGLKRAYDLGKKIPGVSGVIDEAEGIVPRLRGLKQLVTSGKVTDVGPGISTSAKKFTKVNSPEGTTLRTNVLNRAKELLVEKDLPVEQYRKIRNQLSKEFRDIEIGGEGRELQSIGKALKANDAAKIEFPLAKTRQRGADARSAVTASPTKNDFIDLAKDINMPKEYIDEMIQEGLRTFANVQRAAKKQSKFPGEFHSGHDLAASSNPLEAMQLMPRDRKFITSNVDDLFIPKQSDVPGRMNYPTTTGDAAGIELGVDNIRGSNKVEHSINIHAAKIAGVPDNWATWAKNFWKRKQGKPTKDFYSDWTNAEREIIRNIPHDWPRKKVVKFMNELAEKRKARGNQGYKDIIRDLKLDSSLNDFPADDLPGPMTKAEKKDFDKTLKINRQ